MWDVWSLVAIYLSLWQSVLVCLSTVCGLQSICGSGLFVGVGLNMWGPWCICWFVSQDVGALIYLWEYVLAREVSDIFMCICHRDWGLWSVCRYVSLDAISLKYLWVCISAWVVFDMFVCMSRDVRSVLLGCVFPGIWILWAVLLYVSQSVRSLTCLLVYVQDTNTGSWSVWVCMSYNVRSLNYLMLCIQHINSLNYILGSTP